MINSYPERTLFLVPTPIGNLEDITLRAVRILSEADIIACEDTRHSGMLLKNLNITFKKLESYHEHNEESKSDYLINEINSGKTVALISDAGTPAISDPGFRLVRKAVKNDINIITLPGPTAFVPALISSGFDSSSFYFAGFPPHKKGRNKFFESIKDYKCSIILYESPYRIRNIILDIHNHFSPETEIALSREISKKFEQTVRGTAAELLEKYTKEHQFKGEFVVVINNS